MAPILHMVSRSYQIKDGYQNHLYYSDLDFVLCCYDYLVGSDFSERVLIVDYLSAVGTGMTVADIEMRRRMDTDDTTYVPSEIDIGGEHSPSQCLLPPPSSLRSPHVTSCSLSAKRLYM